MDSHRGKKAAWKAEANDRGPTRLNANWPPKRGRKNIVTVMLDEDEYTRLYITAKRNGVPMSWVMRRLILQLDPDGYEHEEPMNDRARIFYRRREIGE